MSCPATWTWLSTLRDRARLPLVFQGLAAAGYHPAQCLNYFAKAYYFVFLWFEGIELRSLALDIIFEHRRSGLISLLGEEMVTSRIRRRDFWVASPQRNLHTSWLRGRGKHPPLPARCVN